MSSRALLIATRNLGKLREYTLLLSGLPFDLTSLDGEKVRLEVEEVGRTFEENAILKARAYARASGLLTLADDSGLEVDALGGAPGVASSRFGGAGLSDADRIRLLLTQLQGVPAPRRTARFRCVIAVAAPRGETWTAQGACEGVIAEAPRGHRGFGYDPVFLLPEWGKTMAELEAEEKNRISHRAVAARRIRPRIEHLAGRR